MENPLEADEWLFEGVVKVSMAVNCKILKSVHVRRLNELLFVSVAFMPLPFSGILPGPPIRETGGRFHGVA